MVTSGSNDSLDNAENKILEFEILNSLKDFIGSEPFGQYLSEYLNNTLSNIDRLGHAIAAEDDDRVKQFSHKLKGSAGNIGALKLSSVCSKMQDLSLEDEQPGNLKNLFQEIQRIYNETRDELNVYINQLAQMKRNVG